MMTLADLITARKGTQTFEQMARKGGLASSAIHKFANGRNSDFPEPESITALAKATGSSEREIIIAAAHGLGFDMTDDSPQLGRLLPSDVDRLPDSGKRALLEIANSLISALVKADNGFALDEQARETRERIRSVSNHIANGQAKTA